MATVLIVEDDDALREVYESILECEGFSILSACNGEEGLKLLSANDKQIDLVLSDVRMPKKNGVEMLVDLRKINPKRPPVLLVSGFSEYTREQAIKQGAFDLLNKPLRMDQLIEALQRMATANEVAI